MKASRQGFEARGRVSRFEIPAETTPGTPAFSANHVRFALTADLGAGSSVQLLPTRNDHRAQGGWPLFDVEVVGYKGVDSRDEFQ